MIVKTSKGHVAFYKSTGKGSPDISKAGVWQPFGGVAPFGNNLIWMVKGVGKTLNGLIKKAIKSEAKFQTQKVNWKN